MTTLYKKKKLNRARESFSEPYFYYTGRPPAQVSHRLGINWVYVWLTQSLKSWEEIYCFDTEQKESILRADALAGIRNKVTGKIKFFFVEFDRAESGNAFDKVARYNSFYKSERYLQSWWAHRTDRFPAVLIVTTGPGRQRTIEKRIQEENETGLEFKVYQLDELKKECFSSALPSPAAAGGD